MTAILIYTALFIWGAGLTKLQQISLLPILAIFIAMVVAIISVAPPAIQQHVASSLIGEGNYRSFPTLETALQASALGLLYGLCLRVILLTVDFVVFFISSTLAIEYRSSNYCVAQAESKPRSRSATQRSQNADGSDETEDMGVLPQSWSMLLLLIVMSFLLMSGLLHRFISEAVRGSQRLATLADNPLTLGMCLDTAKTVFSGMVESALSISLIFFLPLVACSVAFDFALMIIQRLSFVNWDFSFLRTLKIPFVVVISYLTVSLLGEELATLVILRTTTGG